MGAQIVVDRTPHVRGALVDDVASRLAGRAGDFGLPPERMAQALAECRRFDGIEAKAACFGISYRAPCDACATGLDDSSVDCVTSTSTFEHVPAEDIGPILAECHRILRPGGVASFIIDYGDHYAYFDRSLTRYNFLGYSERHWRLYNSALQYQNRLRHSEYVALVRRSGFDIVTRRRRPSATRSSPPSRRCGLTRRTAPGTRTISRSPGRT